MTTLAKAGQPKGVLSSDRLTLSWAQKQEFFRLVNQGVEEKVARALAIALAKSSDNTAAIAHEDGNRAFQYARQLNARRGGDLKAMRQMMEDRQLAKAAWDESQHPRNKVGAFDQAGGGGASGGKNDTKGAGKVQGRGIGGEKGAKAKFVADRSDTPEHLRYKADMKAASHMAKDQSNKVRQAIAKGDHAMAAYHLERLKHYTAKQQEAAKDYDAATLVPRVGAQIGKTGQAVDHLIGKPLKKSSYSQRFVEAARKLVPVYYLDQTHTAARSAAGGDGAAASRKMRSLDALWDRRNALVDEIEEINEAIDNLPPEAAQEVEKSIAPVGQVHVDVPMGDTDRPKRRKKKLRKNHDEMQRMESAQILPSDDADQKMVNAARLVAGMDWEQRVGAYDVEDAWARASRQLAQDLAFYDGKFQRDDSVRQLQGLDLDLGSGQARAPGYLGLDLYPYDYGTAVHDLSLGIPTKDKSVRSIRLVNVLDYMPDYKDDATGLLVEMQRVLVHGGKIIYQGRGDLTKRGDWKQVPGLVLVSHADTTPLYENDDPTESDLHNQVFERVRVKVPRIYGADPTWMGAEEDGPDDIAFAIAAMGGTARASRVMEDLLTEIRPRPADIRFGAAKPIVPKQNWQRIIYSVVYAPNELDHDGEYMEPADIEKMAHDAIRERIPIKVEHTGDPIGAHIVESYVAPADFVLSGPYGPQPISKGSWVVAIQFTDDEEWDKVVSGAYRGISVGGRALLEQR